MLVVDRSVITALALNDAASGAALALLAGDPQRCTGKGCALAYCLGMMGQYGLDIMPRIRSVLKDHEIAVEAESPEEHARAVRLFESLAPAVTDGEPDITFADCTHWAMAECRGGRLATLNWALVRHAHDRVAVAIVPTKEPGPA
jgi:hypothetical protein